MTASDASAATSRVDSAIAALHAAMGSVSFRLNLGLAQGKALSVVEKADDLNGRVDPWKKRAAWLVSTQTDAESWLDTGNNLANEAQDLTAQAHDAAPEIHPLQDAADLASGAAREVLWAALKAIPWPVYAVLGVVLVAAGAALFSGRAAELAQAARP